MKIPLLIMGAAIGLISCTEPVENIIGDQGYDFFPVQTDAWWEYEVEEVLITGAGSDTLRYFLRETIGDSVQTVNGITVWLLNRYKRTDSLLAWQIDSVWTVRTSATNVVVVENNVAMVKLTFPVRAGAAWNGNAQNSLPDQVFYFTETDSLPFAEDWNQWPAMRVVLSEIPANLVNQDERSEIYVQGIGLVQKDYRVLRFCQSNCPAGQAEAGRVLKQKLIKYGGA